MICPHCNAAISDDSAFCSACGKRLEPAEEQVLPADSAVCPGCGSVNSSGANFCTNCRAPLSETALEQVKTQNDLQLQQAQVKMQASGPAGAAGTVKNPAAAIRFHGEMPQMRLHFAVRQ